MKIKMIFHIDRNIFTSIYITEGTDIRQSCKIRPNDELSVLLWTTNGSTSSVLHSIFRKTFKWFHVWWYCGPYQRLLKNNSPCPYVHRYTVYIPSVIALINEVLKLNLLTFWYWYQIVSFSLMRVYSILVYY